MKLSEARPCDKCRGKIVPMFYRVRVDLAMFNAGNTNGVLGTAQILGGLGNPGALAIAEVLAPRADDAIIFAGDKEPSLVTELFLCNDCYLGGEIDLAMLFEAVNERRRRRDEESGQPDRS